MVGSVYEGKTFDDAVRKGLEALRLSRAEAVITTVEEGKGGFLGIGAGMLVQAWTKWVDRRPEHQIRFSEIELSPQPDAWVKGGRLKILEEVRAGTNLGETVPILELDLKKFETDFRRCFPVPQHSAHHERGGGVS